MSMHVCQHLQPCADCAALPQAACCVSQEVQPDARQEVDGLLRRLGGDTITPVVCVDMGSTPRMGLLPAPARFAAVLDRALEAAGCGGLMLTGGYGPLAGSSDALTLTLHCDASRRDVV